jgi:hypothetical protein
MTLAEAVRLTRRYSTRLRSTASTAATATATIWDQLGSWDEADIERFTARAAPVVAGAQRSATALAAGYLALLVGDRPVPVDSGPFLDLVDLRSPFLAYWGQLGRGAAWDEAITAGRSRSEQIGLDGTTAAARSTSAEVDRTEERITGWERVSSDGCEWCALVSTQCYHSAESASFGHARCNCDVIPIVGDLAPGQVINRPLLDNINMLGDDRTGYVDATGNPASRPPPTPVEAP